MRAGDLIPNPKNWRTHPGEQEGALTRVLEAVGIADAVVACETDDGLMIIDGHLRADLDPDQEWPVLVLDVDQGEADELLLSLDTIAMMAGKDRDAMLLLARSTDADESLLAVLGLGDDPDLSGPEPEYKHFEAQYGVTVICTDEEHQRVVFEELVDSGHECKVVCV